MRNDRHSNEILRSGYALYLDFASVVLLQSGLMKEVAIRLSFGLY